MISRPRLQQLGYLLFLTLVLFCAGGLLRSFLTRSALGPTAPPLSEGANLQVESMEDSEHLSLAQALTPSSRQADVGQLEIRGLVSFADGARSSSGFVVGYEVGFSPTIESMLDARNGKSDSIALAAIQEDGSFVLEISSITSAYSLEAVSPGGVSVARRSPAHAGDRGVEIGLEYLYGVAIQLEDSGGGALKAAPNLFGDGPTMRRESGNSLHIIPPALLLMEIGNLDPMQVGARDRWQYLVTSKEKVPAVGPLEYKVRVPGYKPHAATAMAPLVLGSLSEMAILLEAEGVQWGDLTVKTSGGEQSFSRETDPDTRLGGVYLAGKDARPTSSFPLHTRALVENETIRGIPAGSYLCYFEANEGYYRTSDTPLEIRPGHNVLDVDFSDAGSLQVLVMEGDKPYEGELVATILEDKGGSSAGFQTKFSRGPYIWALLPQGDYRLKELLAPGRVIEVGPTDKVKIWPDQVSVRSVTCQVSAPGVGR